MGPPHCLEFQILIKSKVIINTKIVEEIVSDGNDVMSFQSKEFSMTLTIFSKYIFLSFLSFTKSKVEENEIFAQQLGLFLTE